MFYKSLISCANRYFLNQNTSINCIFFIANLNKSLWIYNGITFIFLRHRKRIVSILFDENLLCFLCNHSLAKILNVGFQNLVIACESGHVQNGDESEEDDDNTDDGDSNRFGLGRILRGWSVMLSQTCVQLRFDLCKGGKDLLGGGGRWRGSKNWHTFKQVSCNLFYCSCRIVLFTISKLLTEFN